MEMTSEPPEPWNDWSTLLGAAQGGDFEAVNNLALAVGSMARRFYLGKGLPVSSAEEHAVTCVTETWLRLPKFHGGNFPAWAHTIFLHLLIDEHRKRAKSVQEEPDHRLDGLSNADRPTALNATLRRAVSSALDTLSANDQLIMRLRHSREPIEFKEIAKELEMKSGAIRTRYSRAKNRIERILRKDPRMNERIARCTASSNAARQPHTHQANYE